MGTKGARRADLGPLSQASSAGLAAVLAFDHPLERRAIAEQLDLCPGLPSIHPSAFINPSVRIGLGCVIMEARCDSAGAVLGRHVVIPAVPIAPSTVLYRTSSVSGPV